MDEQIQREKSQTIMATLELPQEIQKPVTELEDNQHEEVKLQANPLEITETQVIPEIPAPLENQEKSAGKMSRKQRRKAEKERKKEEKRQLEQERLEHKQKLERERRFEQERQEAEQTLEERELEQEQLNQADVFERKARGPALARINEVCRILLQHDRTHPDWKRHGLIAEKIMRKDYGSIAETYGNLSEQSQIPQERRDAFNKKYPELISGGGLTRDVTEFLPADATDELIRQTILDMKALEEGIKKDATPQAIEQRKDAQIRIAGLFNGYYEKVREMMENSGANPDAPFSCDEEIVTRTMKVSEIFRFVQVGTYLSNRHVVGLVPPEQRAYVSGVYEYTMSMVKASSGLFGDWFKNDKVYMAEIQESADSGGLTLGHFIEKRMQAALELDRKEQEKNGGAV